MPLRRALRLPRPEDPAGMLLIRIQLRLDEMSQIALVVIAQVGHGTRVFAIAGSGLARAGVGEGAVVSGALAVAVQPFGAVGLGAGPFAYDGPFVGAG